MNTENAADAIESGQNKNRTLVIAIYTPLHRWFTTLILRHTSFAKVVILDFRESCTISEKTKEVYPGNVKTICIPLASRKHNRLQRLIDTRKTIRRVRTTLSNQDRGEFDCAIFHDAKPEMQLLIHLCRKKGGEVNLVEDGVAIYETGGRIIFDRTTARWGRFVYGPWFAPTTRIGQYTQFDAVIATYPPLVRSDIRTKRLLPLQIPTWKESPTNNARDCHISTESTALVLMPLSVNGDIDSAKKLLSYTTTISSNVRIKFHPRETDTLYRNAIATYLSSAKVAASDRSAEEEILQDPSITSLIVHRSSAAHITALLEIPNFRIVNVEFHDSLNSEVWAEFYKAIGIRTIKL